MVLRIRIELMTFRASTERSTNMSYLSIIGGTSQSRTENTMGLSLLPLPVGIVTHVGTPSGIRTHTVPSLNRMTLPIGLQEHIGTRGWT